MMGHKGLIPPGELPVGIDDVKGCHRSGRRIIRRFHIQVYFFPALGLKCLGYTGSAFRMTGTDRQGKDAISGA